MSDLRNAKASGFLNQLPHYNSIFGLMDNPGLTQILENLITESSLPLKSVERDFAVDIRLLHLPIREVVRSQARPIGSSESG